MTSKKIVVDLPSDLYESLERVAEASGWSIEEVVLQAIKTGSPPNLSKVPVDFHADLISLNKLTDKDLLRVVEGDLPDTSAMDERRRKADYEILRRTYALFLLRWRGHPVPRVYEALISS
jgi:hypothetical protein